MLEAGLVAARFLHYATALALFGLALFPLYTYPSRACPPPARLARWLHGMVTWAMLGAFLSAIALGVFAVANMTGDLSAAADRETLQSVIRETGFGQVWVVRLGLFVALLVLVARRRASVPDHPDWVTPLVAGALLVSLAGVGHTQASDGMMRMIHMCCDGVHLLAAGAWLGGLLALGYLLMSTRGSPSPDEAADARVALVRFSGMGYLAVAALVGSGLINIWCLVRPVTALTETTYGQLLVVKLCLFAGMLVLAASNRLWLVPSPLCEKKTGQPSASLCRLRQNVLCEQALGLFTVLIVSYLGTLSPTIGSSP